MSRRRRTRLLRPEERALWQQVVRAVTPLRPRAPEPEPAASAPVSEPAASPPVEAPAVPRPVPPKPPPLAPLEPKVRRRLNRGGDVDARIDLHGLTQATAHRRLQLFIVEAQARGHGLVLVITGKGDGERLLAGLSERGVLRRAVPLWLGEPMLRPYVLGFETAARHHGGDGALYVRIRRKRGGPGQ